MRKILIIAIIGLFTTNLSAINDTTLKVPLDSLQLTYKEVYKDIKSGISAIADGLKIGSEHVYGVLVEQQTVKAIIFSIFLLLGIICIIYFYSCFYNKNRYKIDSRQVRDKDNNYIWEEYIDRKEWNNSHVAKTVISGLVTLIILIISFINIDTIITGFINPEYGAIHEILTIIK